MKFPVFIGSLVLLFALAFIPDFHSWEKPAVPSRALRVLKDSIVTVRVSFTGDLMCHIGQYENSKQTGGTYDFNPSFTFVKPYLETADVTMGNLELTFAGTTVPYAGYPIFNTPDTYADALKNAGFDFVVTSNNHAMDTDEKGLLRTLDVLKKVGIGSTGTFKSPADHDSVRVLNIKGIKLGVLNYTYGTNNALPPPERRYEINVIDTLAIQTDIARARNQGAELVLVYFHYGQEMKSTPNAAQELAVRKSQEYGADIIIGGHPHVISPVNYYKTKRATLDTGIVAWSLGNFISNQYWRYTDAGVIFTLTLRKNVTQNKYLKPEADYFPTWVYRGMDARMRKHIVFPAQMALTDSLSLPPYVDGAARQKMKEAFEDTKGLMTKDCKEMKLRSLQSK
jgi:poly-gamma-glutamate capsule biosynthesis protein CapA/YwtB (metallophosphatase superfamily)